jgi:hypothetical protein
MVLIAPVLVHGKTVVPGEVGLKAFFYYTAEARLFNSTTVHYMQESTNYQKPLQTTTKHQQRPPTTRNNHKQPLNTNNDHQ